MKKPFKIVSTVQDLARHLKKFVCDKSHPHSPTQGADTVRTGNYTVQFCEEVMRALEGTACFMNLTAEPLAQLYSGKEKDGYTVDAVDTTGWIDLLEILLEAMEKRCGKSSGGWWWARASAIMHEDPSDAQPPPPWLKTHYIARQGSVFALQNGQRKRTGSAVSGMEPQQRGTPLPALILNPGGAATRNVLNQQVGQSINPVCILRVPKNVCEEESRCKYFVRHTTRKGFKIESRSATASR
eukprot:5376573-Amphidinium_carterae.2